MFNLKLFYTPLALILFSSSTIASPLECNDWASQHPNWLWCDDFEVDSELEENYFEVKRYNGRFGVVEGEAFGGNAALRSHWQPGVDDAGNIKFSFGKTPVAPSRYKDRYFSEIYWRFYTKTDERWTGNANKLTRIIAFSGSNWSEAMIAHVWQGNGLNIAIDPASGVSADLSSTTVNTTRYNDFSNLRWLGYVEGTHDIYSDETKTKWNCIEAQVKLNTLGQADGVFRLWVNDELDAENTNLNFVSSYSQYGLNAIFIENYKGGGSEQEQYRYFDNFVVSTQRIGCNAISPPVYPPNFSVDEK
ncbi:hypothetical protein QFX18_20635 [Saccharophagus degradans]|uniref:polysaccharide lyase n=1 Tax=Saccharophagus degradans TaxID=86304 RepID=UPI0024780BF2|nr:hypothetical protein [Saccharophagus degradans]WGO98416.1 hypothetical protein QFX18_20635 [Saccharophagus degradans]